MIHYPAATPGRLLADVNAHDAGWIARAQAETQRLIQAGAFRAPPSPAGAAGGRRPAKPPSLWADVKIVYMRLQRFKCIFCERALAREDGKIEHDVEHYRPKNAVRAWRAPRGHAAIAHQAGGAADTGYYWLAYNLENYAAACKPCNTTLKRSYFPIASGRGQATMSIPALDQSELPYLIFPLREDPAQFITFRGTLAVPRATNPHDLLRATTTIAIFNLNTRQDLIDDRFRLIRLLSNHLELAVCASSPNARNRALLAVADLTGPHAPHSACGKAFVDLTKSDPALAAQIVENAWAALPADVAPV